MRRIIYSSRAAPELDRAELFRLLYHARAANEAAGLTGVLLHSEDRLLQVLEGRTWKLFATFEKIRRDLRHHGVTVIDERSIEAATFPSWPMRYFDARSFGKAAVQMTETAGGALPPPIAAALADFAAQGISAQSAEVSPWPPRVGLPSSPKPC